MAMARSFDSHLVMDPKEELSRFVRMLEEEPNSTLPEKRSRVKYSPVRERMVDRSRCVHDLRGFAESCVEVEEVDDADADEKDGARRVRWVSEKAAEATTRDNRRRERCNIILVGQMALM
mmetsp:Transcript_8889/g.19906  ORF Transcript_8889/g.19906 Transcript_8889/m.19906 type:complete len:120 (+) Transcript_8889:1015-1374(+)